MSKLKTATRIDYTGRIAGFNQFDKYDQRSVELIRKNAKSKVVVIIDQGYSLPQPTPHLVADHLNLSGSNPLVGPNPDGGPRFPVINNIYMRLEETFDPKKTLPLTNPLSKFPSGVVAGLKEGVVPDAEEMKLIHSLGAQFYCYNAVPAMLVAAHLGLKVFTLIVPEGQDLDKDSVRYLKGE